MNYGYSQKNTPITTLLVIFLFEQINKYYKCLSQSTTKSTVSLKLSIVENCKIYEQLINLPEKLSETYSQSKLKSNNARFSIINADQKLRNIIQLNTETGILILISNVDREELCLSQNDNCSFLIIISCFELIIDLEIAIIDINDENPTFLKNDAGLFVMEDAKIGTIINLPLATDLDSPKYGIKFYSIEENNKFTRKYQLKDYFELIQNYDDQLKSVRPILKVIKQLDRELCDKYSFILTAFDYEKKSGKITVDILVKDVNDQVPQWIGLPYELDIDECTKQRQIFHLQASDNDDPNSINSKMNFKLDFSKSNQPDLLKIRFFIADNHLNLIESSLKGLADTVIYVPLKVVDGGGLQNITMLKLRVKDCNDFSPEISLSGRLGKIQENQNRSSILTFFTVKDLDLDKNCQFECHLNDSSYLKLKTVLTRKLSSDKDKIIKGLMKYYQIETANDKYFDRESIEFYSVMIVCEDYGVPSMTSSQVYNVVIADQNDHPPVFQQKDYNFNIRENLPPNTLLGTVQATDRDIDMNAKLTYSLVGDIANNYFRINRFTGSLTTKAAFDREEREIYNFTVKVQDAGLGVKYNDTTQVTVRITDENDCKPHFTNNYHFEVVESFGKSTIHHYLGQIEAVDADSEENSRIIYSIVPGQSNSIAKKSYTAQISRQGKLTIYGLVDREEENTIFIEVEAKDQGRQQQLSSVTTVTVTVLDLNDNKPKFLFPSMDKGNFVNITVPMDNAIDQSSLASSMLITKLEAVDQDQGLNGTVYFELVGNSSLSPVFINREDGRVYLKSNFKKLSQHVHSDRILIRAIDGNLEEPKSELSSILLRYITYDSTNPFTDQSRNAQQPYSTNNLQPSPPDSSNHNRHSIYSPSDIGNRGSGSSNSKLSSNYVVVLYCLSGLVFLVFVCVLSVLLYFYSVGRCYASGDTSPDESLHTQPHQQNNNIDTNKSMFSSNLNLESDVMFSTIYTGLNHYPSAAPNGFYQYEYNTGIMNPECKILLPRTSTTDDCHLATAAAQTNNVADCNYMQLISANNNSCTSMTHPPFTNQISSPIDTNQVSHLLTNNNLAGQSPQLHNSINSNNQLVSQSKALSSILKRRDKHLNNSNSTKDPPPIHKTNQLNNNNNSQLIDYPSGNVCHAQNQFVIGSSFV